MALKSASIMLIGAGNMGGALMGGWLANGVLAEQICILDPNPNETIAALIDSHNICHEISADKLEPSDVIVVAVKPQIMQSTLQSARHLMAGNTVAISVAAGKTLAFMREHLGEGAMVRAMPNTPALVGRGITVACGNSKVSELQKSRALALLSATGNVEWVGDENLMDAVTAVSGSGPAYAFLLAETLGDAGIAAGLPETLARKLALETVAGAGELMMQSPLKPATLRENVTSPGGTTQAALEVLMGEDGFAGLLETAVAAARKRSQELS